MANNSALQTVPQEQMLEPTGIKGVVQSKGFIPGVMTGAGLVGLVVVGKMVWDKAKAKKAEANKASEKEKTAAAK